MKAFFKFLPRWALFFSLSCFFLPIFGSMLQNIDQTYQILPQEDKKFSITNGAIAWETGWLNNFHRFANFDPIATIDRRNRKVISYDPNETDAVTKLVQILFYRVPGSTSYTDFSTTTFIHPKGPDAPNKIAALIANIVFGLDQLAASDQASKQAKDNLDKQLEIVKKDETINKNKLAAPILKKFEESIANFEKTHNVKALEAAQKAAFSGKAFSPFSEQATPEFFKAFEKYNQQGQRYATWINSAQSLLELNPKKFLMISPDDFTKIIIKALDDCDSQNPAALYPENVVHTIWLGFLYKAIQKASGTDVDKNRQALQTYYSTLGQLLNKKLDLPEITLHSALNPFKALEETKKFLESPELIAKNLDSFTFYAFKAKFFPSLVGYADAKYKPLEGQSKPFIFADCMENCIANFIRIMSYDITSSSYNLATLEERLGGIKISKHREQLGIFLKNPFDHERWVALASNIPYVPYWQLGKRDGSSIEGKVKPFMPVGNDYKDAYEAAGYTAVTSPDEACFDLGPSIRSLIIVLNHLLDLDLFENKLAKEGLRPDFIAHYFPALCAKLQLTGYYALSPDETKQEVIPTIDELDKAGKQHLYSIFVKQVPELENKELRHVFDTTAQHGEYQFIFEASELGLANFFSGKNNASNNNLATTYAEYINKGALPATVASLLEHILAHRATWQILKDTTNQQQYSALYALPLYNPDRAFSLISLLLKLEYRIENKNIGNLLLSLIQSIPDPHLYSDAIEDVAQTTFLSPLTYLKLQKLALQPLMDPTADADKIYSGVYLFFDFLMNNKLGMMEVKKIADTFPALMQEQKYGTGLVHEITATIQQPNPPLSNLITILQPLMTLQMVPNPNAPAETEQQIPLFEAFLPTIRNLVQEDNFKKLSAEEQNKLKAMIKFAMENITIIQDKLNSVTALLDPNVQAHMSSKDIFAMTKSILTYTSSHSEEMTTLLPKLLFHLSQAVLQKNDEQLILDIVQMVITKLDDPDPMVKKIAFEILGILKHSMPHPHIDKILNEIAATHDAYFKKFSELLNLLRKHEIEASEVKDYIITTLLPVIMQAPQNVTKIPPILKHAFEITKINLVDLITVLRPLFTPQKLNINGPPLFELFLPLLYNMTFSSQLYELPQEDVHEFDAMLKLALKNALKIQSFKNFNTMLLLEPRLNEIDILHAIQNILSYAYEHPNNYMVISKLLERLPDLLARKYGNPEQIRSKSLLKNVLQIIDKDLYDANPTTQQIAAQVYLTLIIDQLANNTISADNAQQTITTKLIPIFSKDPKAAIGITRALYEYNILNNQNAPLHAIIIALQPFMASPAILTIGQEDKPGISLFEYCLPIITQLMQVEKISSEDKVKLESMIKFALDNFTKIQESPNFTELLKLQSQLNPIDIANSAKTALSYAFAHPGDEAIIDKLFAYLPLLLAERKDERLLLEATEEAINQLNNQNKEVRTLAFDILLETTRKNPHVKLLQELKDYLGKQESTTEEELEDNEYYAKQLATIEQSLLATEKKEGIEEEASEEDREKGRQELNTLLNDTTLTADQIIKTTQTILIPLFTRGAQVREEMLETIRQHLQTSQQLSTILSVLQPFMTTTQIPFSSTYIDNDDQEIQIQLTMPLFENFLPILQHLRSPEYFDKLTPDEQNALKNMIDFGVANFTNIKIIRNRDALLKLLELQPTITNDDIFKATQAAIINAFAHPSDDAIVNGIITFLPDVIKQRANEQLLSLIVQEMKKGLQSSNPEVKILALDMILDLAKKNPRIELLEFLKQQRNNIPTDNPEDIEYFDETIMEMEQALKG